MLMFLRLNYSVYIITLITTKTSWTDEAFSPRTARPRYNEEKCVNNYAIENDKSVRVLTKRTRENFRLQTLPKYGK